MRVKCAQAHTHHFSGYLPERLYLAS